MKNKSENKNEVVRMELKYCECCGSLWLRVAGMQQVYCPECLPEIEQLPQPTNRVHRSRLPLGPRPDMNEFDFEVDFDDLDSDFDFDFEDFDAGGMA